MKDDGRRRSKASLHFPFAFCYRVVFCVSNSTLDVSLCVNHLVSQYYEIGYGIAHTHARTHHDSLLYHTSSFCLTFSAF